MFGSEILEIAVGLAFIYLLLSLIVTAVTEMISRLTALRSRNLYQGIQNLLGELGAEKNTTEAFFNTPIIKSLTQPGRIWWSASRRPGYITAKRFYEGLLQSIDATKATAEEIEALIESDWSGALPAQLAANLKTLWAGAGADLEKFQAEVESWYDDSMDRVSGWFKRKAHTVTLVVAVVVAVTVNASTINIVETLWNDDTRRLAVTKLADGYVEKTPRDRLEKKEEAIKVGTETAELIEKSSILPLGWKGDAASDWDETQWLSRILGWIITAFALSLGAPFWFDLLKKVVNLRTSGANPNERAKQKQKEGK